MELARPVVAVLYSKEEKLKDLIGELSIREVSQSFLFPNLQRYYSKEMGGELYKVFLCLDGFMQKEDLKEFKLWSLEKEKEFSKEGRRTLNIDPGYVDESHLVLASSKKRGGRLYLGEGVYAEIEYLYLYGGFRPLYWTYWDYRDRRVREFFQKVRENYLKNLNLAWKGEEFVLYRFSKDKVHKEVKAW
ncbi:MAG: DUF4416 family protein [Acidobacteria bacterium]|nr:MAG: DUF4416 family protein [Acidobacteriota bacterium]